MPGPLPLPVMRTEARIPLEHRANSILFGRRVVKRSHGETHDRTVDTCGCSRREAQLAGASPPHKHLLTAQGAGRCGHSSGATGTLVFCRWTGRLRRPWGFGPAR